MKELELGSVPAIHPTFLVGRVEFSPPEPKGEFMEEHIHEKVYSNIVLTTYPCQRPWICKICGQEGIDVNSIPESYESIREKFDKSKK